MVGYVGAHSHLDVLKERPCFKFAHLNIHSLTCKIAQLRLDLLGSGFDIFAVSETWLNKNTELQSHLTSILNYNLTRRDRQTLQANGQFKTGAGIGIYYRDSLQGDADKSACLDRSTPTLEIQWILITRPHMK
jgi:hypothetical protein